MSTQPQFETAYEMVDRLWREGENTYDISVRLSQHIGEPIPEHQVCQILTAVRARQAKGGAQ